MLAAHLNELGLSQQPQQAQPELPPQRMPRHGQSVSKPPVLPPSNNHHGSQSNNILDPVETQPALSDTDSEPDEPNDRTRNDGTLLASDPPKPL